MGKKNPFKVPDNFFENFNQDIIERIENIEKQKSSKKYTLFSYVKWLSTAAVITGVALVGYYSLQTSINNRTDLSKNKQEVAVVSVIDNEEVLATNKQLASLQNDYYLFIEDETMQEMYKDYIDLDNL